MPTSRIRSLLLGGLVAIPAVLAGACDVEHPLVVDLRTSSGFDPQTGALHTTVQDSTRFRWYEGQYSLTWADAGVTSTTECIRGPTTVDSPRHLYSTDFKFSLSGSEYQPLYLDIAKQVGHLMEFPPIPVPVGEGIYKLRFTGKYKQIVVPITVYVDRLRSGVWVKVDHTSATFSYRYFDWGVESKSYASEKACHDQGAGF